MIFDHKLVTNVGEAIVNVQRFASTIETRQHPDLEKVIPNIQHWYAIPVPAGAGPKYWFGPSKYIGYREMTPRYYLKHNGASGALHGRATQDALLPLATTITELDERHSELHTALIEFCDQFDQGVRKGAVIHLLGETTEPQSATEAEQVRALAVLIRPLSRSAKSELKRLAF